MATCAICGRQGNSFETGRVSFGIECATCGKYEAGHILAIAVLKGLDAKDRRRAGLSAYVREANKQGATPQLTADNWEGFAEGYLHASVSTKLRRVLERARELTTRAGQGVQIYQGLDYPLFHAVEEEVPFLIDTLLEQKLLARKASGELVITAAGWAELEPTGSGGVPGTCFVAMSFKPELDSVYDQAIQPAIVACGFDVIQLSRVEHSENINDKIIAELRRAQFVVADFTFHPGGVYFEAGYALGLGRLVIWTCRKSHFKKAHFDTRPYNHIVWEHESELREKLMNRIRALVPNAKTE
jgi:nucleoside 2-deoxyribosyltransferase